MAIYLPRHHHVIAPFSLTTAFAETKTKTSEDIVQSRSSHEKAVCLSVRPSVCK